MGFLDEMMISGDISGTLPSQDPFAFGLVYTGVLIILLVLYMQIPSITNMIMVVGGSSGMIQGLTGKIASNTNASGRFGNKRMSGGTMATSVMGTSGPIGSMIKDTASSRMGRGGDTHINGSSGSTARGPSRGFSNNARHSN